MISLSEKHFLNHKKMKQTIFFIALLSTITFGFSQENKTINELISKIDDVTFQQYQYIEELGSSKTEDKVETAKKLYMHTTYKVLQLITKAIKQAEDNNFKAIMGEDKKEMEDAFYVVRYFEQCKKWQLDVKNQTKAIINQLSDEQHLSTKEFIAQQHNLILDSFTNFIIYMKSIKELLKIQ